MGHLTCWVKEVAKSWIASKDSFRSVDFPPRLRALPQGGGRCMTGAWRAGVLISDQHVGSVSPGGLALLTRLFINELRVSDTRINRGEIYFLFCKVFGFLTLSLHYSSSYTYLYQIFEGLYYFRRDTSHVRRLAIHDLPAIHCLPPGSGFDPLCVRF